MSTDITLPGNTGPETIHQVLLAQIENIDQRLDIPVVTELILPSPEVYERNKYAKFGLLVIGGQACGFFYRLLGLSERVTQETEASISALRDEIVGANPAMIARWLVRTTPLHREIGMAAINAITQWVWQQAAFNPVEIEASGTRAESDRLPWHADATHIGMVGYFGPMVERLLESGKKLTVLELDDSLHQHGENLTITGDVDALRDSQSIYCTASTLLNNTLESLLEACAGKPFALIGPTAGCFPDALFDRGVTQVGGSLVADVATACQRVRALSPWLGAVQKFSMARRDYPGFEVLVTRALQQAGT